LEQVQNTEVRDILLEFEFLHLNSGVDAQYNTLNHRIYVLGGSHRRQAAQSILCGIDGDMAVSTLWTSLATVPCVVFANVSMRILRYVQLLLALTRLRSVNGRVKRPSRSNATILLSTLSRKWLGIDLNVGHSISATNTHCDKAERLRTEFDKFARKLERGHRTEDMTDEE
jgi:hypothetical protein